MKLFEPLRLGGHEIQNRIAVTAMVTRLSGSDGYVNEDVIERYVRFAEGGAGLIVVEATAVHGAKSGPLLRLSEDGFIPGIEKVAGSVHDASEAKIVLQIIHFLKIARSGWRQKVTQLSTEELEALPALFRDTALRAKRAGMDGVELHMAHAYTLSSLLSRKNKRTDRYGGSIENRMRMPSMVIESVRCAVGPDFIVGVRFDAEECIKNGYSLPDATEFAIRFASLGVDYVSLSAGGKFEDAIHRKGQPLYPYTGYSGDRCMPGSNYPDLFNIHLSEGVKAALLNKGLNTPVMGSGKIPTAALAEELLQKGSCDIVGFARSLLADPYWPKKLQDGRSEEIVRCIYCNVCKRLDENFRQVRCYLWPEGTTHAPRPYEFEEPAIAWASDKPLTHSITKGGINLSWESPRGNSRPGGFDIFRSDNGHDFDRSSATQRNSFRDISAVSGRKYFYYVRAYDESGRRGLPSNIVEAELPDWHEA